jgi:rsbT co-antagonist protein RsbR
MVKKNTEAKVAISRRSIGGETPVNVAEVIKNTLYAGFSGVFDSARMKLITDRVLDVAGRTESDAAIIDLSAVDIIDSAVAVHLSNFAEVLKMLGIDVIFCGITPEIAQTMVSSEIRLGKLEIYPNFKKALTESMRRHGLMLVPVNQGSPTSQQK